MSYQHGGGPQGYGPPGYGPPGYGPPGYGHHGHGQQGHGQHGYGSPGHGQHGFRPPAKKRGLGALLIVGGVLLVGFGGCVGLLLIASKPETAEQKAAREKDAREARESRDAYVKTLTSIREKVKGLDLDRMTPKKCDEAKMQAQRTDKNGQTGLHVVFAPYLDRFTEPESSWKKDEGPWSWVTDPSWAGFFDAPPSTEGYSARSDAKTLRDYWVSRRYMIVVVPRRDAASSVLPKVPRKGDFESGYFSGWAVVFDQTDATVACQFELEVENSNKVGFRDSGAFNEDPETAILKDFQDNFEDALEKGIPSSVGLGTSYGKLLK